MLANSEAFSGFSVDDVDAAARFYGETLGLRTTVDNGMLVLHLGSGAEVIAYPKETHVPATFTILNFPVDDIDAAVEELTGRGVRFERYDGFGQDERGISRNEYGPPIAWFTDPAGNVIAVLET